MCEWLAPPLFALPAAQQSDSTLPILACLPSRFCGKRFQKSAPSFCSGEAGKLISVLNPKKQRCRHAGHKLHESIENVISADFLGPRQKRDILYNNAAKFLRFDPRTITVQ
jgi:hypothetical protein